jgi:hypothetical protein
MRKFFIKILDNSKFILLVTVLLITSFIVWQVRYTVENSKPSITKPSKENIPEGFKWIEETQFGYLYPTSWPKAIFEASPVETAVLDTIQHPKLLYDKDFDIWVIAESVEDFKEGDVYPGLAVARRERNLSIYEAGFSSEDCGFSLYVFEAGGQLVQLKLPTFCFGGSNVNPDGDAIEFNEQEFDREQEVLFSITPITNPH